MAVAFGNSFYVHGGFDGTSRVSDFWLFDLSSMCWREVVVLDGRPPSPRHSHSAVVHSHSLYVYGGYDGSYSTFCNIASFSKYILAFYASDSHTAFFNTIQNRIYTNSISTQADGI